MNNFMNVAEDKWEVDMEGGYVVQCWTNAKPFKSLPGLFAEQRRQECWAVYSAAFIPVFILQGFTW